MSPQSDVIAFIQSHRNELIHDVSELVAFRTGHHASDFQAELLRCQQHLAEKIRATGAEVELFTSDEGYPVTLGRLRGTGTERALALNGHVDVKPPGDRRRWETDPWSADDRCGRLYGRGTADMKGGVAAALFALRALRESGIELQADVWLHLVSDEEVGGFSSREILNRFPLPNAVIVPEPTGLQVMTVEGGMVFLRIELEGVETHAGNRYTVLYPGYQPKGVSAIEKAVRVVAGLQELERNWANKKPHPLLPLGFNTLHPGIIEGGPGGGADGQLNIPRQPPATFSDYCSVEYNIWFTPYESYDEIRREVEEYVRCLSQLDPWLSEHPPRLTWEVKNGYVPAVETPVEDPVIEALRAGLRSIGRQPVFGGFTATADLAWYAERGVPGALFGPGEIAQAHSPNEFVAIDQIVDAATVLALAIHEWAAGTRPSLTSRTRGAPFGAA